MQIQTAVQILVSLVQARDVFLLLLFIKDLPTNDVLGFFDSLQAVKGTVKEVMAIQIPNLLALARLQFVHLYLCPRQAFGSLNQFIPQQQHQVFVFDLFVDGFYSCHWEVSWRHTCSDLVHRHTAKVVLYVVVHLWLVLFSFFLHVVFEDHFGFDLVVLNRHKT